MGSNNYFGEMSIGSGNHDQRSSRKNMRKNNHNSEKPNKQPQRGLGVAQLEKMRLHGQIPCSYHLSPYPTTTTTAFNQEDLSLQIPYSSSSSSSSSYGFQGHDHQSFLMGNLNEFRRPNINFGDSHGSTARWTNTASNGHFFNTQEDIQKKGRKDRGNRPVTYSQNCETSHDDEELDLELRL